MRNAAILVVYYSRTGNTRRVAEQLAHWLGCDVEALRDRASRRGIWGALRSAIEATLGTMAWVAPSRHDPATYDLVEVGTPVWTASVSSPVRSYLMRHRLRFRNVAFFCTCGGTGSRRALRQMTATSMRRALATLVVREGDLKTNAWEERAAAFLARLEAAVQRSRGRSVAAAPA
jgi:flavodoxin